MWTIEGAIYNSSKWQPSLVKLRDEDTYSFQMGMGPHNVAEDGGSIEIHVTRTGPHNSANSAVDVSSVDGTAIAGDDYSPVLQTLNFTLTKNLVSVYVTIHDDESAEDTECFTLKLENTGYTGPPTEICIVDNEVWAYNFEQASYSTNEGDGPVDITVIRTGDSALESSLVDVVSSDGTAIAGQHYVSLNTTLDFTDTNNTVFTVTIIDDDSVQGTHCFNLSLVNPDPSDGQVGADTEICIIDNEDVVKPVFDQCPPVLQASYPTDLNLPTAVVSWTPPNVADNSGGTVTVDASHMPGEAFDIGVTRITMNATDESGNMESCVFNVTVVDNQDPYFEPCPASFTVQTDPQQNTANVSWPPVIPMDFVAVQEYNSNYQPGHLFPIGDTDVEYNVTDTSGNKGSCFFVVTVEDMEPPAITCPSAAIVTDTDPQRSVANVTFVTTAADNSGEWTVSCTPASATNFQVGVQNVMCIATDPSDNTETCSFAVLVSDNEDPVFDTCPSDITLNEPLESFVNFTIMVNWTRPGVTDNVGVVRLDVTHEPGSVFGIDSHLVMYTAYDAADNMATCQFNVIVNDVQPPVITGCPVNLPRFPTDPTRDTARAFWDEPQASDNSGSVTRTSNYDVGDAFPVGDTVVVYTAEDGSGNAVNCSFVVQVYDNEPPTFTGCPFQGVTSDTGLQSDRGVASWSEPQGTDNVAVASVQSDYRPGDSFPLGATVVTYNVTDTAGLVAECAFTITISDGENPSLTNCPASFTLTVELATDTAVADWTPPTASDNSGTVTLSTTFEPGQSLLPGEYSVTYTATDPAGRTATCPVFTITVEPNHNECSLPEVMGECSSRGLTCVNQLEGYTCDCPTGFFKAGNSDNCLQGRMFRFTFVIVEISNSPAVFTNELTDPTSVAFLSHQRRLENLFSIAFGNLSEFGRIIVLYFFSGSIGVEALISVNGNSTANQTEVENSIDAAISADNLFLNSEYKLNPSATTFLEEVCPDGFCDNGGTCQPNASSYLSSCVCPAGYSGNRCETVNDASLSTAVIVAMILGITGLIIIVPTAMIVCLTMMKRAMLARGNMQQSATMRPSERRMAMYDAPHPRIYLNKGFRPSRSEFIIPYVARSEEADIPLREMMSRDESLYY
ncbi:hyalin-like isoform X3 [Patiria miniata]|uniref:Hyalin n=1 Tax=Patiria miniata TaxID=46514 RepID=A0A914BGK5_PATMI|nr:hyalin-like isoform X3 [Patiria miniata]